MPPIPQGDYADYVKAKLIAAGATPEPLEDPAVMAEVELSFRIMDLVDERKPAGEFASDEAASDWFVSMIGGIVQALACACKSFGAEPDSVISDFEERMAKRVVVIRKGSG